MTRFAKVAAELGMVDEGGIRVLVTRNRYAIALPVGVFGRPNLVTSLCAGLSLGRMHLGHLAVPCSGSNTVRPSCKPAAWGRPRPAGI